MNGRSRRLLRLAALVIAVAMSTVVAGWLLLPLAVRALLRALELTLNGSLLLAASLGTTTDGWAIAGKLAHAVGAVLLTTPALTTIALLLLVAAIALYGLQK